MKYHCSDLENKNKGNLFTGCKGVFTPTSAANQMNNSGGVKHRKVNILAIAPLNFNLQIYSPQTESACGLIPRRKCKQKHFYRSLSDLHFVWPFLSNLPHFSRIETERYSLDMNSPFGLFLYIYIYIYLKYSLTIKMKTDIYTKVKSKCVATLINLRSFALY